MAESEGDFEGPVAWIPRGASGIGAATARSLATQGARVGILDIDVDKAHSYNQLTNA